MKRLTLLAVLAIVTTSASWLMWMPAETTGYTLTVRPLSGGDPVRVLNTTEAFVENARLMALSSNTWATSGVYLVEIRSAASNVVDVVTNHWRNPTEPVRPWAPNGLRVIP